MEVQYITPDGAIIMSNEEYKRMYQYSELGKYCIELIRGGCGPKGVYDHIKKQMAANVVSRL